MKFKTYLLPLVALTLFLALACSNTTGPGDDDDWNGEWVTVYFEGNNGSYYREVSVKDNHLIVLYDEPTLAGNDFAGWYTDDGTFLDDWDFANDKVSYLHGDYYLYAKWELDNPSAVFEIYNVTEMGYVGKGSANPAGYKTWKLNKNYKLMNNITLAGNWAPIGLGTWDNKFSGSFDGNSKTISGLTINKPTVNYQGLFGEVTENVVIKDLGLLNVDISGASYVGGIAGRIGQGSIIQGCYVNGGTIKGNIDVAGIAGWSNYGTIRNCYVTSVAISGNSAGGIVGNSAGNSAGTLIGRVENCYVTSSVTFTAIGTNPSDFGGIAGTNYGSIKNCYTQCNMNCGTASQVGGISGTNQYTSVVENCFSTGNISGSSSIAGVVGITWSGTIKNCYATGNISGNYQLGGITGSLRGYNSKAENCYATGSISHTYNGTAIRAGGIAGGNENSVTVIINCVALAPSIISDYSYGTSSMDRVIGNDVGSSPCVFSYGRTDMVLVPGSSSFNRYGAGIDVSTGNAVTASWWTAGGRWDTTNGTAWDLTTIWNPVSGSTLPTLRNMPGSPTQNPTVKP